MQNNTLTNLLNKIETLGERDKFSFIKENPVPFYIENIDPSDPGVKLVDLASDYKDILMMFVRYTVKNHVTTWDYIFSKCKYIDTDLLLNVYGKQNKYIRNEHEFQFCQELTNYLTSKYLKFILQPNFIISIISNTNNDQSTFNALKSHVSCDALTFAITRRIKFGWCSGIDSLMEKYTNIELGPICDKLLCDEKVTDLEITKVKETVNTISEKEFDIIDLFVYYMHLTKDQLAMDENYYKLLFSDTQNKGINMLESLKNYKEYEKYRQIALYLENHGLNLVNIVSYYYKLHCNKNYEWSTAVFCSEDYELKC